MSKAKETAITPIYIAIENSIKQRIDDKVYREGEKLPAERELTEEFGVSRSTIRQVISNLEKEGIIYKITGKGAFVSKKILQRSMEIKGFSDLMRERGLTPSSKILKVERRLADDEERLHLNLPFDGEVYYISRIRYADKMPMAIEYSSLTADFFPDIDRFDLEKLSLYDILIQHYNLNMSWATDSIRAAQIKGEEAKILFNKKSGLALFVTNILYNINNIPVEYTKTLYHAEKYSYNVISTKKFSKYKK